LKDRHDTEAVAALNYWLATFETNQAAANVGAEVNEKGLVIFSPAVYSYVEDCETYDETLVALKQLCPTQMTC